MATLLTQRSVMAEAMANLHAHSQIPQNQGLTLVEMSWAVHYASGPLHGERIGDAGQTLCGAASQFCREKGHRALCCTITLLNGHSHRFWAYSV